MKVTKLINSIQKKCNTQKILAKEAEFNKYIKIHDIDTYGNSYGQMMTARETIANYAKHNAVTIDIYDAKRAFGEDVPAPVKENLKDKLEVIVTNMLNGTTKNRFVDANTDKLYNKVAEKKVIVPKTSEDTEIVRVAKSSTGDSFLRNLYRNIEAMTKEVTSPMTK